MARRIVNRKEKRAEHEAAEARKRDDEVDESEDETEDEEEEADDDDEDEAGADTDDEEEASVDDEDAEEAPVKKRKSAAKAAKAPKVVKEKKPRARSRSAKVTRMKLVWGVYNNSYQPVATFDYSRRKDAEDLAAKLTADKKTTHFVQPKKEPIEEKKEKEKE